MHFTSPFALFPVLVMRLYVSHLLSRPMLYATFTISMADGMRLEYRKAAQEDLPFMKRMLYEAVYWRTPDTRPSFEEAMGIPGIAKSLAGWGERPGDTGVIAWADGTPAGAAYVRFWHDELYDRGYINEDIPVLVIAVAAGFRRRGIASAMITQLAAFAAQQGIPQISLMVAKDNVALALYRKEQFTMYEDRDTDLIMIRDSSR